MDNADITTIEGCKQLLELEDKNWEREGFHHGMAGVNQFALSIRNKVLTELVLEHLGLTEEDMELKFWQTMLEVRRDQRAELMLAKKQWEKEQRLAGLMVPDKTILGPDGSPIGI